MASGQQRAGGRADQSCAGLGTAAAFRYPSLDFSHSRTAQGPEPRAGRAGERHPPQGRPPPCPRWQLPGPQLGPCAPLSGPCTSWPLSLPPTSGPPDPLHRLPSPAQLFPEVEKAAWWKTCMWPQPDRSPPPSATRSSYCFSDSCCQECGKAPNPGGCSRVARHPPQWPLGHSLQP